ncbi:hypothetical protein GUJ93_ZPchr0001g32086 [Zizania palustris]|uniref:Uncharacterized protein n=1 Tax=Zizania palustris TaxID=103762 RepID=A0A8J5RLA6_ZIZPA|nr:hypothetical protein GUJ93_ZPchr0001g32086 [Zizania palustris]
MTPNLVSSTVPSTTDLATPCLDDAPEAFAMPDPVSSAASVVAQMAPTCTPHQEPAPLAAPDTRRLCAPRQGPTCASPVGVVPPVVVATRERRRRGAGEFWKEGERMGRERGKGKGEGLGSSGRRGRGWGERGKGSGERGKGSRDISVRDLSVNLTMTEDFFTKCHGYRARFNSAKTEGRFRKRGDVELPGSSNRQQVLIYLIGTSAIRIHKLIFLIQLSIFIYINWRLC